MLGPAGRLRTTSVQFTVPSQLVGSTTPFVVRERRSQQLSVLALTQKRSWPAARRLTASVAVLVCELPMLPERSALVPVWAVVVSMRQGWLPVMAKAAASVALSKV